MYGIGTSCSAATVIGLSLGRDWLPRSVPRVRRPRRGRWHPPRAPCAAVCLTTRGPGSYPRPTVPTGSPLRRPGGLGMKCPRCQQDNPSHAKFCRRVRCALPAYPRGWSVTAVICRPSARSDRGVRAAGGDQRDPAGHQSITHRCAAGVRRDRGRRRAAVRGQRRGDLRRRRQPLPAVAHRGPVPIAGPVGEAYPITRGRPCLPGHHRPADDPVHDQAAEIDTEFPDLKAGSRSPGCGYRILAGADACVTDVAIGVDRDAGVRRSRPLHRHGRSPFSRPSPTRR